MFKYSYEGLENSGGIINSITQEIVQVLCVKYKIPSNTVQ